MAIIRIKRTTSDNLPQGLTFGELAFVQGVGNDPKNRLYICDSTENLKWIGAEIVNTPNWIGATASTVVPTVAAVKSFVETIVDGSNSVFDSNIEVSIPDDRSFGKYTNGDTILSSGRTAVEVIVDALTAYLVLEAATPIVPTHSQSSPIIFNGQGGSVTWGVTWGYKINSPGYTALGATLEWKRANQGEASWTPITGQVFFDNTSPYWTKDPIGFTYGKYQFTVNHTAYDTVGYNFRYKVHDAGGGVTSGVQTVLPQTFVAPTVTPQTVTQLTVDTTSGDSNTNVLREYGNTGSQFDFTVNLGANMSGTYHVLNNVAVQYRVNGGTWYSTTNQANQWNDIAISNSDRTKTVSITPAAVAGTPVSRFETRYRVSQTNNGSVGGPWEISGSTINFQKRVFFGATNVLPNNLTSSDIRALSRRLCKVSASPNTPTISPVTTWSSGNPGSFSFDSSSDANKKTYVVAVPAGLTLQSRAENPPTSLTWVPGIYRADLSNILFGSANTAEDPVFRRTMNIADFSGVLHEYNVYTWEVGVQYSSTQTFYVTYKGTVV